MSGTHEGRNWTKVEKEKKKNGKEVRERERARLFDRFGCCVTVPRLRVEFGA